MTAVRQQLSPSYRTLINRAMVEALKAVFDPQTGSYKDPQFDNIKISTKYPLAQLDYPSIVVEYEGQRVVNAGVGHEEWFNDPNGVLRKWHHRRFEGTTTFTVLALSPLDRDIFADSIIEVLSFGRLDSALLPFFTRVYGDPTAEFDIATLFNQIALNVDEIDEGGNNVTIAPWAPEDVLVYATTLSLTTHGGFYNTLPIATWQRVSAVKAEPYPQGEVSINNTFEPLPPTDPHPDLVWTNPFAYEDSSGVRGTASISGTE